MATPAITPEVAAASAAPQDPTPAPDPSQGDPDASGGDNGPLSSMNIEPAENGGAVITHHKKMPDRVKNMEHEDMKPRTHVAKDHKELMKHLEHHTKRLKT